MNYLPTLSSRPVATTPPTAATPRETRETIGSVAGNTQRLLKDCLRKALEWEEYLPKTGAESANAIQLRILVENLIRDGHPSIIAMCKVRTMLCSNCRQLHAAHEQCDGQLLQPLDRCLLLEELDS